MRFMDDEAVFQFDDRGPGGSQSCTVMWDGMPINAAAMLWQAPNGHQMIPLIVLRCPCCDFPVAVRPDIHAACHIENGLLSLRQVVACPAHWPRVDDDGNVDVEVATGRAPRISCPWRVIILQGKAHHLKCRAVSRVAPGPCQCDQLWRKR